MSSNFPTQATKYVTFPVENRIQWKTLTPKAPKIYFRAGERVTVDGNWSGIVSKVSHFYQGVPVYIITDDSGKFSVGVNEERLRIVCGTEGEHQRNLANSGNMCGWF